jgi:hypothetical protein
MDKNADVQVTSVDAHARNFFQIVNDGHFIENNVDAQSPPFLKLLSAVARGCCGSSGRAATGSCIGGESGVSCATDAEERNAKRKAAASKRMSEGWDESEYTPMLWVQVQSMRQRKHGDRLGKGVKTKGFGTSGGENPKGSSGRELDC